MYSSSSKKNKTGKLHKFNNLLSLIVIGLPLYIIVLPFLPNVTYKIDQITNSKPLLVRVNTPSEPNKPTENIPTENTIVIPSMNLQKTIFDGSSVATLRKGVWHRPNTSNPAQGGNTIMAGHRYGYNGDGVFYHLDKVHKGDDIFVYWQSKKHHYVVNEIKVVPPTDLSVEASSALSEVTLYTCTPMWTFTDRLVIVAEEVI